uniref:Ig-like domain-containing protein n=1 Tax=Gopherus evgoodei TaxID=1825980 RepID=A0A8C4YQI6_9SAUR
QTLVRPCNWQQSHPKLCCVNGAAWGSLGAFSPGIECWPQCQARAWSAQSGAGISGAVSHGLTLSPFAVSATAPSVFPLTSCTGEVTTPQVTFGCLAKGYFPEPVTVTWSPNVSSSGVRSYPSVLQPSSGLYSLSSQVTVPASSWESNTYRCTVEHQPTSSSISKEIPKPPVPEPTAPEVEVFYSCTTNPGTVQLVCLISGFSPKPLTVEWLVDGEHGLLHSDLYPVKKDPDSHTYSIRSNSSVPQSEWLTGKTYTCQVYHQGTATTKQAHARMCEEETTSPSNIQVFLVPPSPAALYVAQSPMLTCLVVNLPRNSSIQVVWSREKPGSIVPEPLTLTEHFNSTITASSSMPILTHDWEAGETFTCKVEHSELPSPLIKSISKKPGRRSGPGIYLLRPHNEELSSSEDSVSVTCLVQGFFPEDISVQWMKNHKPDETLEYITTQPIKDGTGDSNFFLYSKLKVSKASWNKGDIYTCMVIHEALSMKFTQRSVSKDSGK